MADNVYLWGLDAEMVVPQINHVHLGNIGENTAVLNFALIAEYIASGAAQMNELLCACGIEIDCDKVDANTLQTIRMCIVSYVKWQALLKVGAPLQPTSDAEREWLRNFAKYSNVTNAFGCEPQTNSYESSRAATRAACPPAWDFTDGDNW